MGIFSGKTQPRDELEKLVDELRDVISSRDLDDVPQIRQIRERFDEGYHNLRDAAVRTAQEAASRAKDHAHAANQYAHDEPWQVAGAAIAVGALLGYLLARR
ncbi:DUF883 domain-containing protein [Lampropedia puyangensis]|uniref:DUF883 domain-containing protein n=1 Tax=Lampropedia puyangensis TaxID=1330072 RepID=A0A4V4GQW1_9BURK|nr:DUF883 family protein [Lampropedia puyangensis]THT98745.1 DUF883 domain-containing protein [Lampropedia puyangensis]